MVNVVSFSDQIKKMTVDHIKSEKRATRTGYSA